MATISPRPTNREEVGTVLCMLCGKGICSPVDLVIMGHTVMHSRCYDVNAQASRPSGGSLRHDPRSTGARSRPPVRSLY
jgi:hypothetical protein